MTHPKDQSSHCHLTERENGTRNGGGVSTVEVLKLGGSCLQVGLLADLQAGRPQTLTQGPRVPAGGVGVRQQGSAGGQGGPSLTHRQGWGVLLGVLSRGVGTLAGPHP